MLQWNDRKFQIRDLMSEQFKSAFKVHEEPKIIEVPGKSPVVEWNNKQHDIRDLMHNKF